MTESLYQAHHPIGSHHDGIALSAPGLAWSSNNPKLRNPTGSIDVTIKQRRCDTLVLVGGSFRSRRFVAVHGTAH
jgi:hypothetical protein